LNTSQMFFQHSFCQNLRWGASSFLWDISLLAKTIFSLLFSFQGKHRIYTGPQA